jgi:RES domain-containing protein
VPLVDLGEIFREAADLYTTTNSDRGDWIWDLLQGDWEVFSERISEAAGDMMGNLTVAILESGLDPKDDDYHREYRELFRRTRERLEEDWDDRIEALFASDAPGGEDAAHHRRTPSQEEEYGPDPIEFAVEDMASTYQTDRALFRARIHKSRARSSRFAREELGAPPPELASAKRANRQGQPVLYSASDPRTALAEVRAWKGAAVALATLRVVRPLHIFDLSGPLVVDSPFFDEHIAWTCHVNGLFRRFAEELSRPVIPGEEKTLYLPSQHVCDVVRAAGLHGIAYPSALGPGHNVVLFDPTAADVTDVQYVRVTSVDCAYVNFSQQERPYEEVPYGPIVPDE